MKYSIKECCVLFEIEDIDDITLCEIKRKYHKLCLKHHPDKSQLHSSDTSEFLKIKDMYEQLIHFKETMCQSSETHKKTDELDIYHYFLSFINVTNIEKIFNWLNNQKDIVNLHVDLNSLFNKKVYYVENSYYVPLWCKSITNHQILEYLERDYESKKHVLYAIHVQNNDQYIKILHNNDIVVYVKNIEKYFNKKIKIYLCESKSLEIFIDKSIQQSDYHIIFNQGIPRFNNDNIYDCSQLSNIVVCFH